MVVLHAGRSPASSKEQFMAGYTTISWREWSRSTKFTVLAGLAAAFVVVASLYF
jgi:hypothetical protein